MYSNRESIKDLSVLDSVSHLFPLKPPAAAVVEFPGVTAACGGHRPRTEGDAPKRAGGVSESTGVHGSTVQLGHLRSAGGVDPPGDSQFAVENGHWNIVSFT